MHTLRTAASARRSFPSLVVLALALAAGTAGAQTQTAAPDAAPSTPVPIDANGAPQPQEAAPPQPVANTVPVQPLRSEATELDNVEVTGSRIRGVDLEKSQPVISISRDDIDRSGLTSLGEVLTRISTAGSSLNTSVNNGGSGSVFVDLRSLGPQRTLVLVNGRRWVNDVGGFTGNVDFNTIPVSIVDRIEVLKDGASALYGSDAIAGVINVITKKDFSGTQVTTQVGEYAKGDGLIQSHSLTVGSSSHKTSAFVDLSYTKAEPVFAGDRDISKVPVFGVPGSDARVGSSTNPYGRYRGVQPAPRDDLTLSRDPGATGDSASDFIPFDPLIHGYNFAPINYLVTPNERVGFFGAVRHELFRDIDLTVEALYQNRRSAQVLAETPLVLGAANGDHTVISADAQYNPFNVDIGDDDTEGVQRRLVEAAGRHFNQDVQTYHLGAALNGEFEAFGELYYWDVGTVFNRSVNDAITTGQVNLDRVAQAVGPADDCLNAVQTDPCIPLNLFGPPGSITPEMLNFILITEQSRLEQEVHDYTGNISGPVWQLPAGPLGLALGVEHRNERGQDTPDSLVASGATSGNARKPTNGSYSLSELYLEAAIPVLANMPFVNKLDLSLAGRTSHYDIEGRTRNVTKGKAGVQYRPIEDLLLRASYAQGFRAPSITELFGGRGDNFPIITDPCALGPDTDGDGAPDAGDDAGFEDLSAAQQQNCRNNGVPAGSYKQTNAQIKTQVGGDPNLEPEESKSLIYGLAYSPSMLPGLTATLDVYKYELTNAIAGLDPQTVLDGCTNTGNAFFCDRITRNGAGFIDDLVAINVNLGGATVKGIDGQVQYELSQWIPSQYGRFNTTVQGTYLREYTQQILDDASGGTKPQNLTGRNTGDIVTVGGQALPRLKLNTTVGWGMGPLGASYTARFVSGQQENCNNLRRAPEYRNQYCSPGVNQDGDPLYQHHVDAIVYHDIQFTYSLSQYSTDFAVGINNFTNQDPPISYSSFANSYDTRTYDVPGAFGYARATISFN